MSPEELLIIQDVLDRLKKMDEKIDTKFDKLEEKIDPLIQWRWRVFGATAIIAIISTALIQIGVAVFSEKSYSHERIPKQQRDSRHHSNRG